MKLTTNRLYRFLAATASLVILAATALPAMAGRVGGAARVIETVEADGADRYVMAFHAGEVAQIAAKGDGDIDIEIYDENGRLVASDTEDDNVPVVTWTPRWTGKFIVRVVNAEDYDVDYALATN